MVECEWKWMPISGCGNASRSFVNDCETVAFEFHSCFIIDIEKRSNEFAGHAHDRRDPHQHLQEPPGAVGGYGSIRKYGMATVEGKY